MTIQTISGNVEISVGEPFVGVSITALIHGRKRFDPVNFCFCMVPPETFPVIGSVFDHCIINSSTGYGGIGKRRWWFKAARFGQNRFNIGHLFSPYQRCK
jgi:hypothetical protein